MTAASPVDNFLANLGFGKKPAVALASKEFTVAVTGASGLVGSALSQALADAQLDGRTVKTLRLVRRAAAAEDEVSWDPETGDIELSKLEGLDAIVHLAGEGVASGSGPLAIIGRWDDAKKERILDSRVKGTAAIVQAIAKLKSPPRTLICSSGVGYYGYESGAKEFDESGSKGGGFLAEVVEKWEAEALKAQSSRTRVVCLRTGVVLDPKGGALGKLLPIFRLGAGGNLGSGQQYFSWISLRDLVRAITYLTSGAGSSLRGPVNACSPQPCTNSEFTAALGSALSRRAIVPIPEFAGSAIFGQMGQEMLFGGQKVLPKKLQNSGFKFLDEDIKSSLASILQ